LLFLPCYSYLAILTLQLGNEKTQTEAKEKWETGRLAAEKRQEAAEKKERKMERERRRIEKVCVGGYV
jgi:hypothetical protein